MLELLGFILIWIISIGVVGVVIDAFAKLGIGGAIFLSILIFAFYKYTIVENNKRISSLRSHNEELKEEIDKLKKELEK